MKLLLATHNQHKRREFERLLGGSSPEGWGIDALPDSVALPPEAAVFTVTTCSSAKRCR